MAASESDSGASQREHGASKGASKGVGDDGQPAADTAPDAAPRPPRLRSRHRPLRSPVTGPTLPRLTGRIDDFNGIVAATADYLNGLWPQELLGLRIDVAQVPVQAGPDRLRRFSVDRGRKVVVLYRLPIERMGGFQRLDAVQRRMTIEAYVFRAVAEYLGKDPWELTPENFRLF